jgi:nicotinamide/nicotinate riboside kinase
MSLKKVAPHMAIIDPDFWKDPEGYFDKIVWPRYLKEHRQLFVDGNVEGPFLARCPIKKLATPSTLDPSMEELLFWALEVISNYLLTMQ